ncbi:hypothetical protein [Methylobacterium sp. Gmos1]
MLIALAGLSLATLGGIALTYQYVIAVEAIDVIRPRSQRAASPGLSIGSSCSARLLDCSPSWLKSWISTTPTGLSHGIPARCAAAKSAVTTL